MTTVASLFSPLTSTSRAGSDKPTNLADDFNNFLRLLTIQLQNQDPLEPLDTNQFTEQIVQMTQVEQTVSMNERLGALIDAQETQRIQTAVDFVGKQADALGDFVPLGPDGAEMFYALENPASLVRAQIIDASVSDPDDAVVRELAVPSTGAGVHRLPWDGLTDAGAAADPTGVYRLRLIAEDANGDAIKTKIGFSGVVEELRNQEGVLTLMVAGRNVSLDQIVAARTPRPKSDPAD